jgi:hypothetical protein
MDELQYYIVPQNIVGQWQGATNGNNGLWFVKNNSGDWVVPIVVGPLWPGIDWSSMQIISLAESDFPAVVIS